MRNKLTDMRTRPTLTWSPTGPTAPVTTNITDIVPTVTAGRVLVLSGAGLSTESGIPDYRGTDGRLRKHTPMTYQDFVASAHNRRRYWARSHLGWRTIAQASPNTGHKAVATLHACGLVDGVITQNVDGLHHATDIDGIVELHGSLSRVICLDCGYRGPRTALDARMHAANPGFHVEGVENNPDGDVDIADELVHDFHVVACDACGTGILKPDVVFFGENVPRQQVERCYRLVDDANALLVLGSSLTVMSGLRFVRRAALGGKPVVIINQGQTRGDRYARMRVDLPLGAAMSELVTQVTTVPLR